jgi:hypothetical protein
MEEEQYTIEHKILVFYPAYSEVYIEGFIVLLNELASQGYMIASINTVEDHLVYTLSRRAQ